MILERFQRYRSTADSLGVLPAIAFKLQKSRERVFRLRQPFTLYSKHARFGLKCRPGTSDLDVFDQIFVDREYRCLDDVDVGSGLVIDCGANVGYSSAYFLSRFPDCSVIAVEPDPGNFDMLAANVKPYGARCESICSAVWSHRTGLVISEAPFGDGREWARTVRAVHAGEVAAMQAVDIAALLEDSGHERISILKIDIEGAEAEVFRASHAHWLGKVDNLVIELHGDACRSIFHQAIADQGFEVSRCDELTVCKRPRATA